MYTLNLSTGIVTLDSDGSQVAPAQSTDDTAYAAYVTWVSQGNSPTILDTSIADAQVQRCNDVNNLRDVKLTSGFKDSNGILWQTEPDDIANITAVCVLITAGAITGNVTWRDANNTNHTMTTAQMVQLAGGMAVAGQTIYGVSWYHKANINGLTTVDAINAYDITAGW